MTEEVKPRGVTQTVLVGDGSGRPGNCWQAAVATFLGLDLDDVPHFAEFAPRDWQLFYGFMLDHGWLVLLRPPSAGPPPERCFAFGASSRGVTHIVVFDKGCLLWDPHPSREGLASIGGYFECFRTDEVRVVMRKHGYGVWI